MPPAGDLADRPLALLRRAAGLVRHLADQPHPRGFTEVRLARDMLSVGETVVVLADGLVGALAALAGRTDHPAAPFVFNRGFGFDFGPVPRSLPVAADRLRTAVDEGERLAAVVTDPPTTIRIARPGDVRIFDLAPFVDAYVVPNGEFHLAMIHAAARIAGLKLGKREYEGPQVWRREG